MLVLSWNIRGITGIGEKRLGRILAAVREQDVDLLLLQEVTAERDLRDRIREQLEGIGLRGFFFSGETTGQKKYGNVIASQWPVEPQTRGWAPRAPWEPLLARATVHMEPVVVDVISAHIPNGSDHGWKKIETFEALAYALQNAPDQPRILGGDFNEPREVMPSGHMITFGQSVHADGTISSSGMKTKNGEAHPRYRWDHAVRSVLAGPSSHGLRHVFHDRHGWSAPTTHVIRGADRFFDHLLVSHHFSVVDAGYLHEWRERGLSDHSAAWARLGPT